MSDQIKITGKVHTVLPLETFASGFTKRVLVIKTEDQYPQTIPVEFVKDKAALLDPLAPGQTVTAFVNLRGSEYNGRYYANIQGWKLDKNETAPAPSDDRWEAETSEDSPF
jgi:hypothetical protein